MRARRFEDLYFWQKSRELAKLVYRITGGAGFSADTAFRDYLRQLGASVMGEIAYGFAQGAAEDFKDSLDISRGDLMRLRALTYLAQDLGHLTTPEVEEIQTCIQDVDRLMMGFIRGMRPQRRDHDVDDSGAREDDFHDDYRERDHTAVHPVEVEDDSHDLESRTYREAEPSQA